MERNKEEMVTLTSADELGTAPTGQADGGRGIITVDKETGAYEFEVDGETAAGLSYTETGTRVTLLATSVFPEFRGKGIGGEFLGGVLDMLRAERRTVTLTCSFATAFVHSHPEYADVVDPVYPGNATRRHGGVQ